jgi:hypothetical protein
MLNAGDELAAQLGQLPGAPLVVEHRLIVLVQKLQWMCVPLLVPSVRGAA